ncbi:MAG: alpha/beta hydrolase [Bacteroidota bacterium]|jgi:predicted esterase
MHIEQKHVQVIKTARYFISGPITEHTTRIVFVLHGYAQLAYDFMLQFEPLFSSDTVFVAPEALNRFYSKGLGGKPAASWMTSEDRESEIADYIYYLNTVYTEVVPANFSGHLCVLGFSQGVATASRWLHHSQHRFTGFIMCSGDIAIELRHPLSSKIEHLKTVYISAEHDPLLNHKTKNEVEQVIQQLNSVRIIFDGGHELHLPSVKQALSYV